jgi:hypothetical protein
MEFQHVSIALLASMVLVLAGMVGWLYWQQQRLFQNMNNIIAVVGELARPPPPLPEPVEEEVAPTTEETAPAPVREEEDDRVSVDEDRPTDGPTDGPADVVSGPPALDTDNLEDKTKKELQDILTKRGIPFSKADNKGALISLLKATA